MTPFRRARRSRPPEPASPRVAAIRLLARREVSEAQLRARLVEAFDPAEVDATIAALKHEGLLDDRRVAAAYARTALVIKRRGRVRVERELDAMGIDSTVARHAVESTLDEVDEAALLDREIDRRARARSLDPRMRARLYAQLIRQGFPADQVIAALRRRQLEPDAS